MRLPCSLMKQEFGVSTRRRIEMLEITDQVERVLGESGLTEGICTVYCPHTTAGLAINENADPDVRADLERAFEAMVPAVRFDHAEGNSPAHLLSCLVGCSLQIPVTNSRLRLGRWQGVFLCEFDGPRDRRVLVCLQGDV